MIDFLLGKNEAGNNVSVDPDVLRTHLHLIGQTGAGKSTAILALLRPIMLQTRSEKSCVFIIDPMGNLSRDILQWIAHPRYSTDDVRDRLVYIQPSREDVVLPFNPLIHTSDSNRYYQVMRTMDIVLRAWDAQDLAQQPRLANWLFNAFYSAAAVGIPIAMCEHLLRPESREHELIMQRIPAQYRSEWDEIHRSRGEAVRILESTRNRLKPFFVSPNLKRMFGSQLSRFDCERFIRERKIILVNLGSYGQLHGFAGDAIGGLVLNEIFETATRLATNYGRAVVDPTYVFVDEFQNYISPDIERAIPTVRQLGLRMVLAHQSFSQLEREDINLIEMIWQARSRLIFSNSSRDADIVADELAKITFDPLRIKHQQSTVRQLIEGHRKEWLKSVSSTTTTSNASMDQESRGRGGSHSQARRDNSVIGYTNTNGWSDQQSNSFGVTSARSAGESTGESQSNVPIHKTFRETSKITFESFDEFAVRWGQQIRRLKTGEAYLQLANCDDVQKIKVDYFPIDETPDLDTRVNELVAKNFESEFFISAAEADRHAEECRQSLFSPEPIKIQSPEEEDKSPFEL